MIMLIKRILSPLLYFIFLYLLWCDSFSQEIKTTFEKVDSLDFSESENVIYDINGDICSMVILNTDLKGIKFYTNLGVEKVESQNNTYKVWIPNQASVLKFAIPGCPLYEYLLPRSKHKYSVVFILVETLNTQKITIQDTTKSNLALTTNPVGAKVYLNRQYLGRSPQIITDPPFSSFYYIVKKKGYKKVSSRDTMDIKLKMISVEMVNLEKSRRYFAIFNYKQDRSYKSPKYLDELRWMPGVTFGVLGKTGYYGSFSYVYLNEVLTGTGLTYYEKYNEVKKTSITAGISQQIGKRFFLYGGPGYATRTYSQVVGEDMKSTSVDLSAGLIIRVGWYYLLQIEYSKSIIGSFSSVGLGFGLNIGMRNKE